MSEGASNTIQSCTIFTIGDHRDKPYTPDDLLDITRNFELYSSPRAAKVYLHVPSVIGHDEDQTYLERTDIPAAGWVSNVWVSKDGADLLADFDDVPDVMANLIRGHTYRTVSAEIYDKPPAGFPPEARGKVLRRVAFLGADIPEVKGLGEIPTPQRLSEGARASRPFAPGRPGRLQYSRRVQIPGASGVWAAFSERGTQTMFGNAQLEDMNRPGMSGDGSGPEGQEAAAQTDEMRTKMLQRLEELGCDCSVFESADPRMLAEMVRVMEGAAQNQQAQQEQEQPAPEEMAPEEELPGEEELPLDEDDPDELPPEEEEERFDEFADEVDPQPAPADPQPSAPQPAGQQQPQGTDPQPAPSQSGRRLTSPSPRNPRRNYAEGDEQDMDDPRRKKARAWDREMVSRHSEGAASAGGQQMAATASAARPAGRPAGQPRVMKYSEIMNLVERRAEEIAEEIAREMIQRESKGAVAQLRKHSEQAHSAEKKRTVGALLERLSSEGKIIPRELPFIRKRLMRASTRSVVEKFSEKGKTYELTEFDSQVEELESRPTLFRELMGQPLANSPEAESIEVEKVMRFSETASFSSALKASGMSSAEYVKNFQQLRTKRPGLTAAEYGVPEVFAG